MAKDVLHELRDINSLKSRRNNVVLILLCFLVGIFSAIIVGTYTLMLKKMSIFREFFTTNLEFHKIFIGIAVFIIMGLAMQFMLAKYPLISGSGIPQVSGLLTKKVKFKWFGELVTKFVGGILVLHYFSLTLTNLYLLVHVKHLLPFYFLLPFLFSTKIFFHIKIKYLSCIINQKSWNIHLFR